MRDHELHAEVALGLTMARGIGSRTGEVKDKKGRGHGAVERPSNAYHAAGGLHTL